MAGTFVSDTIQDGAGNTVPTTTAIRGSARAWVRFTSGASPTILNSFNVSSVTYNTTGQYTFNLTTSMPNANYVVVAGSVLNSAGTSFLAGISFGTTGAPYYLAPTTSSFTVNWSNFSTSFDPLFGNVVVFSS